MTIKNVIVSLAFSLAFQLNAQWVQVGGTILDAGIPPQYSNSHPIYQKLQFNPLTNEPVVMSLDYTTTNGTPNRPTVLKYDGMAWVTVGVAQFTPAEAEGLDMAIHPTTGEIYVSFYDNTGNRNGGVSVMKYDGISWDFVGPRGFEEPQEDHFTGSPGSTNSYKSGYRTRLAISPITGNPYICFAISDANGDGVAVMQYNANSSVWESVGGIQTTMTFEGISTIYGDPTSAFTIDPNSGNPVIFAKDSSTPPIGGPNAIGGSSVKEFDGTNWVYIGNEHFTQTTSPNIFDRNILFANNGDIRLTYFEGASGFQHHVMELVSGVWTDLQTPITGMNGAISSLRNDTTYITSKGLMPSNALYDEHSTTSAFRYTENGPIGILESASIIREFPINGINGQSSTYYLDRESMAFHPVNGRLHILTTEFTDDANKSITLIMHSALDNTAPTVANPIPDLSFDEDETINYQVPENTFADVDGNTLSYSATLSNDLSLPSWLSFDGQTRTFSGTPLLAQVGTITIKVTADDAAMGTVSDEFDLEVIEINDTPFLHPSLGGTLTVPNGTQEAAYFHTFSPKVFQDEEDGVLLTYTLTYPDDSPVAWLSMVAPNQGLQGIPKQGDTGTNTYKLTVEDSGGLTASTLFDLTVSDINIKPSLANAVPNQIANVGEYFEYQIPANTFEDLDGDALTYTAALSIVAIWGTFDPNTRTISGTPSANQVGVTNVTISAFDGGAEGSTSTPPFQIQVVANTSPIVSNPIPDQTTAEDAPFNFQFASNVFDDADAHALSYTAELSDGNPLPDWIQFEELNPREFTGTPLNEHVGLITIRITADDGNGGDAFDEFDLTISNTNDSPTAENVIPNQITSENELFTFQFASNTFDDVDAGDQLTYSLANGSLPSWLTFTAATRTFEGTPSNADVGELAIEVIATDQANEQAVTDFTITVQEASNAPTVANPIANQDTSEDAMYSYTFASNTFTDLNQDVLTYTASLSGGSPLPTWLTFNATTRSFSGTPANEDVTTIAIHVTADDGNGGTAIDIFDLTVNNINDVPTVANPITAISIEEDELFDFQFPENTFEDIDGDALTYSATLEGSSSLPSWLLFDITSRTFSGTPLNENVGTMTIYIAASDGNGGNIETFFDLNIVNTNDAPIIVNAINDQASNQGVLYNFTFSEQVFSDVDTDVLSYTAFLSDNSPLPAWITFNATDRNFSGTPQNADVSTITINLTADDGNGGTASDIFDLTINNINDVPTVSNQISSIEAEEDLLFDFKFPENTFEDIDGDVLSYLATLEGSSSLPNWLTFDAASRTFSGTPLNENVGIVTIYITANDGNGGIAETFFDLNVFNTNDAPIIVNAINDQTSNQGVLYNFTFSEQVFSDIDNDSLNYTAFLSDASPLPTWLTFNAATRNFSGTPANENVSTITIHLTADDANGGTVTDIFDLEIKNINDAPTVTNPITAIFIEEDELFDFQFPENTFEDIDGDVLSYSATLEGSTSLPSWLAFDATSRTFSGTPLNEDVGTVTIFVIADDGNDGSANTFFDITVVNVNDAPTVTNPIKNQITRVEEEYHYQFDEDVFNDLDVADNLTYSTSLADDSTLPKWLNFEDESRTFSGVPNSEDAGKITIKVTATDESNSSVSDEFILVIDAPLGSVKLTEEITIYPNPVESNISFNLPSNFTSDMTISVFTLNGSEVKKWTRLNGHNTTISVEDLKSGMYLLQIESDNETVVKRFIKK